MATRPLIVAHRGGAPHDIENSLGAFIHGLDIGADLIECDLRLTADGVVVLYHDVLVGGVPVGVLSLPQARQMVPTLLTLDELMAWQASRNPAPKVVLDLKERGIESAIVPLLADEAFRRRVLVTTKYSESIRRLKSVYPDLRTGLSRRHGVPGAIPSIPRALTARLTRHFWFYWLLPQVIWSRADFAVLHHELATWATIRRFNAVGIRVYAWTVDDCLEAQRLARDQVDLVATNRPQLLRGCLGLLDE